MYLMLVYNFSTKLIPPSLTIQKTTLHFTMDKQPLHSPEKEALNMRFHSYIILASLPNIC